MSHLGRVIVLLVVVGWAGPASAFDGWLYGGIGAGTSPVNDKPNLWKQAQFPYDYAGTDLGWRTGIGAGVTLAAARAFGSPMPHGLFVELGAVSLGAPSIRSRFVPDDHLRAGTGRCEKHCGPEYQRELHLQDHYLGGELVAGYQATLLGLFRPYVKTGVAGFAHTHSGWVQRQGRPAWHFHGNDQPTTENFEGLMVAMVVGGGLCGQLAHGIQLCGDVEKFFPVAQTANPLIGSGPVLTTCQVRIPLTGWW